MYFFGTILIVAGIALALLSSGSYALVTRGRQAALDYGRAGAYGAFAAVCTIWVLLVSLFLAHRFDIAYVNNYSSLSLGTFFTIAASWAGQPGSFAIWALFTAVAALLLVRGTRHFEPYVLTVMMLLLATMLGFMLVLNPFVPTIDPETGAALTPPDGRGLNPTLENFWMIIHPPILFVGYALAAVPFAFALGGLLRRDYDTWVTRALPWTLAAWSFLGLGLLLGGYWAYETLGWGGYWGWDPVENASLVPWLLLTALLHGMLVQRTHGSLRRSNFLLAIFAYLMVWYATFLTRSGVYANFSVHSFVAEGLYGALVGFLLLLVVVSTVLMVLRWRDMPTRALSDKFFSRDSFFVLGMLTIVLVAALVGIGTSMPVISAIPGVGYTLQDALGATFDIDDGTLMGGEAFEDGRFSLTPSFYQQTTPPLGIVIVALMIAGPLLGWRDSNLRHLLRALRWPAVAAVIATCFALFLDVRDNLSLAYVGLGVFAAGANLVMIIRTLRSGWMRIGGYLVHVGMAVFVLGVVGSTVYATPEERLVFSPGETARIYDHDITFNGWQDTPDGKGVLDLTVSNGNTSFSAHPHMYVNRQWGAVVQTPSVKSYLWKDLYIAPAEYLPETNPNEPMVAQDQQVTAGPYEITFTEYNLDMAAMMTGDTAEVGVTLNVLYEGEEHTVTPVLRLVANESDPDVAFQEVPAKLPGGHEIVLTNIRPEMQLIFLKINGLDLPIQPEKAVITVSTKPLVLLVWLGFGIGVLGGFVALIRRHLEGQSRLSGQSARLPRGLSGLAGRLGWRGVAR
ncbi:MAG: heme lyase CcmF/NrfE family subunit [Chloroflexaceae bacterium]